jgi:hypothetical protein
MVELTDSQLARQDFVDNSIFELIQSLSPPHKEIVWDIEMIGEVRDRIAQWVVERLNVMDEMSFYPYIEE